MGSYDEKPDRLTRCRLSDRIAAHAVKTGVAAVFPIKKHGRRAWSLFGNPRCAKPSPPHIFPK
jgi:hypothetical protein